MSSGLKIGFLGAGRMATALARGFLNARLTTREDMVASDPLATSRADFTKETTVATVEKNSEVARDCHVLILAVKPAHAEEVLGQIHGEFTENHVLISIVAGMPLARVEAGLPPDSRVIRVMPNTPALVGASASAYATGKSTRPEDSALVQRLFAAVGLALPVKESLLDAVTGLSGSGPAYVFLMIEALSDGGVAAGLPRDIAIQLAAQTVMGSARLVLETGLHPGTLKDMVTSPGGTTIEGLHALERAGVRAAFIDAVRAASEKSHRLGQR